MTYECCYRCDTVYHERHAGCHIKCERYKAEDAAHKAERHDRRTECDLNDLESIRLRRIGRYIGGK